MSLRAAFVAAKQSPLNLGACFVYGFDKHLASAQRELQHNQMQIPELMPEIAFA